jgi:tRNA A-37 threonylcarbamoyl transferase component Bud32
MTSSSPDQLTPGTILADRYEIIRRLGAGGMGTVYLARHRLMDRLCAVKVLAPSQHRDQEALHRFTREAQNASRIVHPCVCTVYDFGTTDDGVAYLAMEYLEGRTLGAILTEQKRLPLDRAIRLTRAIAAGLDAAHELGIVHRDLKPDNVMVLSTRTGEAVKLVDFGIAKALEKEPGGGVTAPGVVIGTPDYMAPEQFAGDPLDPRADIYALGVMFYRMATGSLPHLGETARDTLTKRLTEPPRPLAEAVPDSMFPEGLQPVVTRVLARQPAERYPTAGAFGTALVELFTGPLEIATMPTVRLDTATAPISPPAPKRRGMALAVGGVVGAAAIAAIVMLRPSLGSSAAPIDTATIQPAPQPPAALPPPAVIPQPPAAAPARDTGKRSTQGTRPGGMRAVNPPPESLRVAPPPPSGVPSTPAPTEKDVDALDVADDRTRDADQAKAVQFYNRLDAGAVVRAKAAFMAAIAYTLNKRYAVAETWIDRAIAMNDLTEPGPERTGRASRYRNQKIAIERLMTSDTTGP